ncbi:MAG: hypothetical protein CMQ40_07615 [Gammaproteobacteria bacterium]|nr:hypothetical protein [Gammaproteobacteria bacterium]
MGVSIDSRTLRPGDLFIALSGNSGSNFAEAGNVFRDGHDFIGDAINSGAAAVMSSRGEPDQYESIQVSDTFSGLWDLGRAGRARMQAPVIAITGSNGKTTARGWLQSLLEKTTNVHGSQNSLNNHWGVPLSLSRTPRQSEAAVFEIGTNHSGEIAVLSDLVAPDVAILLNVDSAHIGNFENMEALEREKLSIASGLKSGVFVLPANLANKTRYSNTLTFGEGGDAFVSGINPETSGVAFSICGKVYDCEFPYPAWPRLHSLLAIFCGLHAAGFDIEKFMESAATLVLPAGRGNIIERSGVKLIDDSYNANEQSMSLAIEDLKARNGRKIAILGEMLELGKFSDDSHQRIATSAEKDIDLVYTFGKGFRNSVFSSDRKHYNLVEDFDLETFAASLRPNDVILVKGSNCVFWKNEFVNRLVSLIEKES